MRRFLRPISAFLVLIYLSNLINFFPAFTPRAEASEVDPYEAVQEIGQSCYQGFRENQGVGRGLVQELFFLPGESTSKASLGTVSTNQSELYEVATEATQNYLNQTLYGFRVFKKAYGMRDDLNTKLASSSNPQLKEALRVSSEVISKQSIPTLSAEDLADQVMLVDSLHQKINQVCSIRHQTYVKLMKMYQNKAYQNEEINPEVQTLLYPYGKPSAYPAGGMDGLIRARITQERELGALETSIYRSMVSSTYLSFLVDTRTDLQKQIGDFDALSCVEKGSQLKMISDPSKIEISKRQVSKKFQDTIERLAPPKDLWHALSAVGRNDNIQEIMKDYIRENPRSIQLALFNNPKVSHAKAVCSVVQSMQSDSEPDPIQIAGRLALTLSTWEVGGPLIWGALGVYGIGANSVDIYQSKQVQARLEQSILSEQIDPQVAQSMIGNIKQGRVNSWVSLYLSGIIAVASAMRITKLLNQGSAWKGTTGFGETPIKPQGDPKNLFYKAGDDPELFGNINKPTTPTQLRVNPNPKLSNVKVGEAGGLTKSTQLPQTSPANTQASSWKNISNMIWSLNPFAQPQPKQEVEAPKVISNIKTDKKNENEQDFQAGNKSKNRRAQEIKEYNNSNKELEQLLANGDTTSADFTKLANQNDLCRIQYTTNNREVARRASEVLKKRGWDCSNSPWAKLAELKQKKGRLSKEDYLTALKNLFDTFVKQFTVNVNNGIRFSEPVHIATAEGEKYFEKLIDEVFPFLADEDKTTRMDAYEIFYELNLFFDEGKFVTNIFEYISRARRFYPNALGAIAEYIQLYAEDNFFDKNTEKQIRDQLIAARSNIDNISVKKSIQIVVDSLAPKKHKVDNNNNFYANENRRIRQSQEDRLPKLEDLLRLDFDQYSGLLEKYSLSDICELRHTTKNPGVVDHIDKYLEAKGLSCDSIWGTLDILKNADKETSEAAILILLDSFEDQTSEFFDDYSEEYSSDEQHRFYNLAYLLLLRIANRSTEKVKEKIIDIEPLTAFASEQANKRKTTKREALEYLVNDSFNREAMEKYGETFKDDRKIIKKNPDNFFFLNSFVAPIQSIYEQTKVGIQSLFLGNMSGMASPTTISSEKPIPTVGQSGNGTNHSPTDHDHEKSYVELLQEALSGHITIQHIQALNDIKRSCDRGKEFSTKFCQWFYDNYFQNKKFLALQRKAQVERWNNGLEEKEYVNTIRAEELPDFETIRIFHKDGRIPKDAEARVLLLPGMGSYSSSSKAMAGMISLLGSQTPGKKGSTLKYIQNFLTYKKLGVESIDPPWHGVGPQIEDLETLVEWLARYIRQMKEETPGLPLYVGTRSATPSFVSEVNRRYPDLIDGMIFISPEMPGRPDLYEAQRNGVMASLGSRGLLFYDKGYSWFKDITKSIVWTSATFGNKPLLILTGSIDEDVQIEEKQAYKQWTLENPNIIWKDIEGADHPIFDTGDPFKTQGREAYQLFYQFLYDTFPNRKLISAPAIPPTNISGHNNKPPADIISVSSPMDADDPHKKKSDGNEQKKQTPFFLRPPSTTDNILNLGLPSFVKIKSENEEVKRKQQESQDEQLEKMERAEKLLENNQGVFDPDLLGEICYFLKFGDDKLRKAAKNILEENYRGQTAEEVCDEDHLQRKIQKEVLDSLRVKDLKEAAGHDDWKEFMRLVWLPDTSDDVLAYALAIANSKNKKDIVDQINDLFPAPLLSDLIIQAAKNGRWDDVALLLQHPYIMPVHKAAALVYAMKYSKAELAEQLKKQLSIESFGFAIGYALDQDLRDVAKELFKSEQLSAEDKLALLIEPSKRGDAAMVEFVAGLLHLPIYPDDLQDLIADVFRAKDFGKLSQLLTLADRLRFAYRILVQEKLVKMGIFGRELALSMACFDQGDLNGLPGDAEDDLISLAHLLANLSSMKNTIKGDVARIVLHYINQEKFEQAVEIVTSLPDEFVEVENITALVETLDVTKNKELFIRLAKWRSEDQLVQKLLSTIFAVSIHNQWDPLIKYAFFLDSMIKKLKQVMESSSSDQEIRNLWRLYFLTLQSSLIGNIRASLLPIVKFHQDPRQYMALALLPKSFGLHPELKTFLGKIISQIDFSDEEAAGFSYQIVRVLISILDPEIVDESDIQDLENISKILVEKANLTLDGMKQNQMKDSDQLMQQLDYYVNALKAIKKFLQDMRKDSNVNSVLADKMEVVEKKLDKQYQDKNTRLIKDLIAIEFLHGDPSENHIAELRSAQYITPQRPGTFENSFLINPIGPSDSKGSSIIQLPEMPKIISNQNQPTTQIEISIHEILAQAANRIPYYLRPNTEITNENQKQLDEWIRKQREEMERNLINRRERAKNLTENNIGMFDPDLIEDLCAITAKHPDQHIRERAAQILKEHAPEIDCDDVEAAQTQKEITDHLQIGDLKAAAGRNDWDHFMSIVRPLQTSRTVLEFALALANKSKQKQVVNHITNMLTALNESNLTNLLINTAQEKRWDDLEILLEHPKITKNQRAIALVYAVEHDKYDLQQKLDKLMDKPSIKFAIEYSFNNYLIHAWMVLIESPKLTRLDLIKLSRTPSEAGNVRAMQYIAELLRISLDPHNLKKLILQTSMKEEWSTYNALMEFFENVRNCFAIYAENIRKSQGWSDKDMEKMIEDVIKNKKLDINDKEFIENIHVFAGLENLRASLIKSIHDSIRESVRLGYLDRAVELAIYSPDTYVSFEDVLFLIAQLSEKKHAGLLIKLAENCLKDFDKDMEGAFHDLDLRRVKDSKFNQKEGVVIESWESLKHVSLLLQSFISQFQKLRSEGIDRKSQIRIDEFLQRLKRYRFDILKQTQQRYNSLQTIAVNQLNSLKVFRLINSDQAHKQVVEAVEMMKILREIVKTMLKLATENKDVKGIADIQKVFDDMNSRFNSDISPQLTELLRIALQNNLSEYIIDFTALRELNDVYN